MKRLLFALFFAFLSVFAQGTTTVTGHISNLGTGSVTSGTFVRFWLRGCGGNQPRVNGTGIIGPSQGGVFFFDFVANSSGNISGTIYSTRDVTGLLGGDIECGGSTTAVWYGIQAFSAGKGGPEFAVHAKNTATLDISNITPITVNPVITAPTGDSTYLRLDAGNSPVTGPIVFAGTVTDNTSHTVTGAANLNGGGALVGTFTGNHTESGNVTLSGSTTLSGNVTATAGQNIFVAYSLNNILFVDGVKYATVAAAVAACPAHGCEIWTPDNYRETLTSQLLLGASATGNTQPIVLRLGKDTVITANVTGGVCAVAVPNASSIQGAPSTIGANGSFIGGSMIQLSSTANVSALICNADTTGSQEYFSMANVFVQDNSSATVSSAVVDLQSVFVPSFIRDSVINAQGHIGLRIRSTSGGSGFGPFNCDNCWINGNAAAGSQPVVIQAVSGGGLINNINFIGGAIEHAGTGQFEVSTDNTSGTNGNLTGINFIGDYCENSFAASSCFKFKDTGNWNLIGVTAQGIAGADVVNIAQSAGSRAGFGSILGLKDTSGYTNLVNDTVRTATIASGANNGSLPFYSFTNPGFTQAPVTFTNDVAMQGGMTNDAAGFKHKRTAGCTTGSTAGNTCTTTVSWTTAFPDTNYTPVCTLLGPATLGHLAAISTDVIAAGSVKVETVTDTNAAISGTINCIAVHD